jgi:hypothetical protein
MTMVLHPLRKDSRKPKPSPAPAAASAESNPGPATSPIEADGAS